MALREARPFPNLGMSHRYSLPYVATPLPLAADWFRDGCVTHFCLPGLKKSPREVLEINMLPDEKDGKEVFFFSFLS